MKFSEEHQKSTITYRGRRTNVTVIDAATAVGMAR
jgi:hypothetical protein